MNEIESARAEMKWDAAVAYLNLELEVALGLVGSPALSIAALPVTKWNAETIEQIMRERINNISKMITRGSFRTDVPPTSTSEPTRSPSSTTSTDSSGDDKLPPGTWLATYQAMSRDEHYNSTITYTDDGAFTFSVGRDFQISGTGRGHISLDIVTKDGRTEARADYSFTVSGVAFMGKITDLRFTRPTEIMKGTSTINDRHEPMPYSTSIPGPMVPKVLNQSLMLKSGESLTEQKNLTQDDGVRTTETRMLTIK